MIFTVVSRATWLNIWYLVFLKTVLIFILWTHNFISSSSFAPNSVTMHPKRRAGGDIYKVQKVHKAQFSRRLGFPFIRNTIVLSSVLCGLFSWRPSGVMRIVYLDYHTSQLGADYVSISYCMTLTFVWGDNRIYGVMRCGFVKCQIIRCDAV